MSPGAWVRVGEGRRWVSRGAWVREGGGGWARLGAWGRVGGGGRCIHTHRSHTYLHLLELA